MITKIVFFLFFGSVVILAVEDMEEKFYQLKEDVERSIWYVSDSTKKLIDYAANAEDIYTNSLRRISEAILFRREYQIGHHLMTWLRLQIAKTQEDSRISVANCYRRIERSLTASFEKRQNDTDECSEIADLQYAIYDPQNEIVAENIQNLLENLEKVEFVLESYSEECLNQTDFLNNRNCTTLFDLEDILQYTSQASVYANHIPNVLKNYESCINKAMESSFHLANNNDYHKKINNLCTDLETKNVRRRRKN